MYEGKLGNIKFAVEFGIVLIMMLYVFNLLIHPALASIHPMFSRVSKPAGTIVLYISGILGCYLYIIIKISLLDHTNPLDVMKTLELFLIEFYVPDEIDNWLFK